MDIDKHLESVLNLAPKEQVEEKSNVPAVVQEARNELIEANKLMSRSDVKDDLDFVREKMREAIENGSDAMTELLTLAKTSQGFEHFTALAALIKALNETNRNLIDLHKGAVEIETTATPDADDRPQVDPNLIRGTQEAVMQMIREGLGVSRGLEAASQTIVLKVDDPGLQN